MSEQLAQARDKLLHIEIYQNKTSQIHRKFYFEFKD